MSLQGCAEGEVEKTTAWPEVEGEPVTICSEQLEEKEVSAEVGQLIETYSWITVYVAFILVIFLGNLIVIIVIVRQKKTRVNVSTLFVLSLLAARAAIAVLVVPARITGIFSERYLGNIMCKLCHYCALGSSTTSVISTVSVALAKYAEVSRSRHKLTYSRAVKLVACIWVFGFAYAVRNLPLAGLRTIALEGGTLTVSCTVKERYLVVNSYFLFIDCVLLFVIPFFVVLFCYLKVIKITVKKEDSEPGQENNSRKNSIIKRISISEVIENAANKNSTLGGWDGGIAEAGDGDRAEKQSGKTNRRRIKDAQMLVMVTLLFTICTSVPYIWRIYLHYQDEAPDNFRIVDRIVYLCSYANPWMNVLVILYFKDDIMADLKKMFCICNKNRQ